MKVIFKLIGITLFVITLGVLTLLGISNLGAENKKTHVTNNFSNNESRLELKAASKPFNGIIQVLGNQAPVILFFITGILALTIHKKESLRTKKLASENEALKCHCDSLNQQLNELRHRELVLTNELNVNINALTTNSLYIAQKNNILLDIKEKLCKLQSKPDFQMEIKRIVKEIELSFNTDKDWHSFKATFEQAHPNFFNDLIKAFPSLSNTELRLCAVTRLSMNIKESASILGISPDSIKVARHRLRKKLNLTSTDNLRAFLIGLEATNLK